nr:glycosyltransferase family 2 protein [Paracoccaceae bacterium]
HNPVRPPVSAPKAAPRAAVQGGRTAIVTTMKNEGPFILEWLAYHRAIGVDDFLIYTNDCTDGTDTMLMMLQDKGLVQHRENPFRSTDLKPQHAALQAAEEEPVMQNCGWGICMDVDEFINIKIGDGTLRALYAAMGEANMISLTWRLFGNADVHAYEDRFLLEQFTACAPQVVRKPHQAWGFKTLFRNIDIYKKLGVHRPKGLKPDLWDQVHWLNGSGKPLPREMFRNGWRSTLETYGYDWVQLNHYAVRSAESFLVKRDRGRVNHVDRDQGMNYWFRMNFNAEQDRSIQRMIPAAQAEFARLMADPDIAAAHNAAVTAHRTKIAALRAQTTPAAFYAELTSDRMQALCRLQQHFGSAVFAAGPEVIPPDLHTRPLPPDFFFTVKGPEPDESDPG